MKINCVPTYKEIKYSGNLEARETNLEMLGKTYWNFIKEVTFEG